MINSAPLQIVGHTKIQKIIHWSKGILNFLESQMEVKKLDFKNENDL